MQSQVLDPAECTNMQLIFECFTEERLEKAIATLQQEDTPAWKMLHTRATAWEFHPFNRFLGVPENEVEPSDFDLMVKFMPEFGELAQTLESEKPEVWAVMLTRSKREHGFCVFSCWGGPD